MDVQQINSGFDPDGCIIPRDFLSKAEVHDFPEHGDAIKTMEHGTHAGFGNVKKNLDEEDVVFLDLMYRGKHLDVLEFLLGKKRLLDTAGFEDSSVGVFQQTERLDG